jgi:hypothetical protein
MIRPGHGSESPERLRRFIGVEEARWKPTILPLPQKLKLQQTQPGDGTASRPSESFRGRLAVTPASQLESGTPQHRPNEDESRIASDSKIEGNFATSEKVTQRVRESNPSYVTPAPGTNPSYVIRTRKGPKGGTFS